MGSHSVGEAPVVSVEPYLRISAATSPVWLHDKRIAYLSTESGVAQVWVTDLKGSEPAPLTHFTERIWTLAGSPDGTRLVFEMDAGGNENQQLWLLTPGDEAAPLSSAPDVIHTFGAFSPDGGQIAFASNARSPIPKDVLTLSLAQPAEQHLILATGDTLQPIAWSPDGGTLLVLRRNTALDNDLLLVPATGGEPVHLNPHTGEALITDAAFTPDGTALYVISNQDREFSALGRVDLATGETTPLATPEWDVEAMALSPAGDWLAYVVNEDGISRLFLHDVEYREDIPVSALPAGVVSGLRWSRDGELLAFALAGAQQPSNIWVTGRDALARRVTSVDLAAVDPASFIAPELIHYPSFDGRQIPAFWYRPAGTGPWPAVVDVHGGPEGQERTDFNPVIQFLLARGFAVLATNVRGSTGYGKSYCHLDDVEKRMDAVADLDAANAWLRAQPEVRADKLVIMGASYGGFMVLASLTTYPDHWAAGVDIVGTANYLTFFEHTAPWRRHLRASEYGDPVRDRELLIAISPIHRAEAITAPLLVLHGRNDQRVPLIEAEQITARLRALGRDVTLRVYEDEGHGLAKLPNKIDGYGLMADFLDRVLGLAGTPAS